MSDQPPVGLPDPSARNVFADLPQRLEADPIRDASGAARRRYRTCPAAKQRLAPCSSRMPSQASGPAKPRAVISAAPATASSAALRCRQTNCRSSRSTMATTYRGVNTVISATA